MPVPVSVVALKDAKTGKPSRVGYKMEGKKKIRITRKSGENA
jgi:large subunit ribosomal protein L24